MLLATRFVRFPSLLLRVTQYARSSSLVDWHDDPAIRTGPALVVCSELGRGATSVVYLAWDNFGQREVTLKIAHPQIFRDAEHARLRKSWLNEVRIAGSLLYPSIGERLRAVRLSGGSELVLRQVLRQAVCEGSSPNNLR